MVSSSRMLKGLDALRRIRSVYLAVLALAFLCLSSSVMAQDATLVGTVTDPSGAAVPNVTITVLNLETSLVHTTVTNDSGQFVLPELKIGHTTPKPKRPDSKSPNRKVSFFRSAIAHVSISRCNSAARKKPSPLKPTRSACKAIRV